MRVEDVIALVNDGITTMPGWNYMAEDFTDRHENAVSLTLTYDSWDYRQSEAPHFLKPIRPHAKFIIDASEMGTADDVAKAVIFACVEVFTHEVREATRLVPTMRGPFNPHTTDGQRAWGDVRGDRAFGIV